MSDVRKIVIFGGSFSPPTLAHEAIIARCLVLPQFDEVWVMPSGDRPDKTIAMSDDNRLEMLHLVRQHSFNADERLIVTDFELRLPRPSQTYRTVRELRRAFPAVEFWFAFGRDSYQSMGSWPHGAALHKSLRMVIFGDDDGNKPVGKNLLYSGLDGRFSAMSSSQVRENLLHGRDIRGLVSEPVARYLESFTSKFPLQPATE